MFKLCTHIHDKLLSRTLNSGLCYTVMIHHLGKRNLWFSSLRNETGWLLGRRLWCLWLRLSFYMERPSSLCFKLNVVPSSDFRKIGDLRLFIRRSIRMKMIHISDTNWHRCHSFPDLFAEQLLNFVRFGTDNRLWKLEISVRKKLTGNVNVFRNQFDNTCSINRMHLMKATGTEIVLVLWNVLMTDSLCLGAAPRSVMQ